MEDGTEIVEFCSCMLKVSVGSNVSNVRGGKWRMERKTQLAFDWLRVEKVMDHKLDTWSRWSSLNGFFQVLDDDTAWKIGESGP